MRSRLWSTLLVIGLLAGVMYIMVSLFLPSSRRLILGVDKRSGSVRLVRNNVTFLPPHRFYRLEFDKRDGSAQRDGVVAITSKEGVPVTIAYRLRFGIVGNQLPDSRRLVTDGWSAWIRARVGEAVSAVTKQVSIEELLSPSSNFNRQRDPLKRVVAAHLERSGLDVTAFEIARLEPDREALRAYKRAELRRGARGVAGRVAIFAIDGADWELISELSVDGRIPNIAALARGGATASMQTLQPTVSPMLWTTAATGVSADRHGIIDFFSGGTPVESYARRAPALWEIAEAFSRHSAVVNWWAAWPPPALPTVVYDSPVEQLQGAAHPPEVAGKVRAQEVPLTTVGSEQVRRFLNISASEYDAAIAGSPTEPIPVFREALAKTWNDHRVAISLYREQSPLLFMMQYEGTDVVNHLFGPYHPPYREGIPQTEYRKYWPAVANYYSEIDRLIGEWMQILPEDTTVILVSAHGFRWSTGRPRVQPVGRAALSDHSSRGIFLAYGNHVAPSRTSRTITLFDLVPTVLAILGLPQSQEMTGQVATWAFKDITPVQSVKVVSYNEFFDGRPVAAAVRANPREYRQSLQAIGHLLDPSNTATPVLEEDEDGNPIQTAQLAPGQAGFHAYYNNLGIQLKKEGKSKEAVEAFQKAIDINPNRPAPYLNMAMALFEKQQYTSADAVFTQAVTKGLPNADKWFVDFAALYRQGNMTSRAIQILFKGKELFPQSYLIAANLGSALAQADRYTEGQPELERALGLQPTSTMALNNLGTLYAKKDEYARALDFWNRSLALDPRQPQIRTAVDAAQSKL